MRKLSPIVAAILLLTWVCAAGYAADTAPSPKTAGVQGEEPIPIHQQEQWQFFFAPYMWIPGVAARTTANGHVSNVDIPWWEIVPDLFTNAIGVMGRFEAWKGRWGFFLDSYFTYVGGDVSDSAGKQIVLRRPQAPVRLVLSGDLKYITRMGNLDFGPRYLVGTVPLSADRPLPVLSFELLGGGRYNYFNQYLRLGVSAKVEGPVVTGTRGATFAINLTRSYLEPFLGGRLSLWLTPKAVITLRGTVGGFGFAEDNNLDSDNELDFGYRVHRNIYAYAGYRVRYDQASATRGRVDIDFSGWIHGPIMGAVFTF